MSEYRVIKLTSVGLGNDAKHTREIIWQGSDISELSRNYPPSQIFGADPLGHSEIEGGHIRFTYHFDRYMPEREDWAEVDDPRTRLTPITATEREIDAENRRLYPGDYYDGCEFCGDASCVGECLPEWQEEDEDCLEETAPHAWFND